MRNSDWKFNDMMTTAPDMIPKCRFKNGNELDVDLTLCNSHANRLTNKLSELILARAHMWLVLTNFQVLH